MMMRELHKVATGVSMGEAEYFQIVQELQRFSGWLSIDDPTKQRMRLTLLDLQPIIACFGDLSSSIFGASGKVKVSCSIRALFKASLAFKTIATF